MSMTSPSSAGVGGAAPNGHYPDPQNLAFFEAMYLQYLENPNGVSPEWALYFADVEKGSNGSTAPTGANGTSPQTLGGKLTRHSIFDPPYSRTGTNGSNGALGLGDCSDVAAQLERSVFQERLVRLIRSYRERGHLVAQLDPLGLRRDDPPAELDPAFYGLTEADLDRRSRIASLGDQDLSLKELLARMRETYCRTIGVQYRHIDSLLKQHWLQQRMERTDNRIDISREDQLWLLTRLTDAVVFEEFLQRKYVGAKTFSLEGAESLIPLMHLALNKAGDQGITDVVIGMAHRGRLNVLANIMGKPARQIFREFEDRDPAYFRGRGDVKYHMGHEDVFTTPSGKQMNVSLCFNPSHLEFVNTVAMGRCRAVMDENGDRDRRRGLTLLVHGDAAFIGEGVVQETLNLCKLPGYSVGGTVHVIVNNQIGFTTGPDQARSTAYGSAVAKMLQSPIFHVNGEDPEAVTQVVHLAMDYREQFARDVVIDMFCYRRRGHNETDEPSFTQPKLYSAIAKRKSVRAGYLDHLLELGKVTRDEAERIAVERKEALEQALQDARSDGRMELTTRRQKWQGYFGGEDSSVPEVDTSVPAEELRDLLHRLVRLPEGYTVHRNLKKYLKLRAEMAESRPLDWAAAEALAFATLLTSGHPIRMSGQDCERGTFSHRHSVLHHVDTGERYMPLANLSPDQARIDIINSPLSETGVLGFEYGYSTEIPHGLTLWEAQFGDFINAAQVIIDQFLASAEDKWDVLSGLVLLLPHGFDGAGPEHSSARLERFLQLCAEDNIQVVNLTTPAQFFHALRRQVLRPWRKPMVVMSPKSLLRHAKCVSPMEDFTNGGFRKVLPDVDFQEPPRADKVRRVLACSGQIYYALMDQRAQLERDDVAIVRVEQIYPLPVGPLEAALAPYGNCKDLVWVQEEPENMGAWRFLKVYFCGKQIQGMTLRGVSRGASASPATGSHSSHKLEHSELMEEAFAGL